VQRWSFFARQRQTDALGEMTRNTRAREERQDWEEPGEPGDGASILAFLVEEDKDGEQMGDGRWKE
jgi:hypothetical protein